MGQVSSKLRRGVGQYFHWCPACEEMHPLPDSWHFDGNLGSPTFSPSFKHEGCQVILDATGEWTGEWRRDERGRVLPFICHYHLTAGMLQYCDDCTHIFAGKTVSLPDLPERMRDGES